MVATCGVDSDRRRRQVLDLFQLIGSPLAPRFNSVSVFNLGLHGVVHQYHGGNSLDASGRLQRMAQSPAHRERLAFGPLALRRAVTLVRVLCLRASGLRGLQVRGGASRRFGGIGDFRLGNITGGAGDTFTCPVTELLAAGLGRERHDPVRVVGFLGGVIRSRFKSTETLLRTCSTPRTGVSVAVSFWVRAVSKSASPRDPVCRSLPWLEIGTRPSASTTVTFSGFRLSTELATR